MLAPIFMKKGRVLMRSGTKHLRIASVIQIILGAASLIAAYFMIGTDAAAGIGIDPENALVILVLTYGGYIFQILAGLFGLLLAKRKSLFTVILGVALFIPQLVNFLHVQGDIVLIAINAILLAIPYYYLHNAYKNLKG